MMPAWLTGIGAKLAVAGAIALAVLLACLKLIGIGRDQEKGKRAQADKVVRDRVDAVRPPEAGETEDSLNKGKF